ncbi:trypsin-like peptidase domain-containing protein [Limnoglobus roseus]|uniref:PDZ domain-containing protein n=1 Tax=Limnoglobus roseus TaxID=2598579 RepID=A0A5C1AJK4_9BACT|nr:trypsin-like peptidase domain-containing protein [Limnoglobus roseus]QEL17882.1 PDZ domain-containing protein [Limnoglobus roseus]
MPRSILITCLGFLLVGPPAGFAADPDPAALQERMKKLIDRAERSVVALVISHNPKHDAPSPTQPWKLGEYQPHNPFPPTLRVPERDKLDLSDARNIGDYTLGSGIVIDAEQRLVLTCYHLIEGARKIYARPSGTGGAYADIVAADARSDLAVLRLHLSSPKLTAVKFADVRTEDTPRAKASVTRGQWVISLAHPFAAGLTDGKASASWGIVSNVSRKAPLPVGADDVRSGYLYQCGSLIQTDARLNMGCSGGGVFNLDGELIGLTSAAAAVAGSESAGGFAMPMDSIYRGIVEVLKTGEEVEYGFLGVAPGLMSQPPEEPGLKVNGVTPGSPADIARVQQSDLIHAVNGRPIVEEQDLFLLIGGALAGREVTLTVLRGHATLHLKATLAKFQHPYATIASNRPASVYGLRVEYSSLLAQQVNGPGGTRGGLNWQSVIVQELEPKSRAEAAFKQAGIESNRWFITAVNDTPTPTPAAFYSAAKKAQTVRLTLSDSLGHTKVVSLP